MALGTSSTHFLSVYHSPQCRLPWETQHAEDGAAAAGEELDTAWGHTDGATYSAGLGPTVQAWVL